MKFKDTKTIDIILTLTPIPFKLLKLHHQRLVSLFISILQRERSRNFVLRFQSYLKIYILSEFHISEKKMHNHFLSFLYPNVISHIADRKVEAARRHTAVKRTKIIHRRYRTNLKCTVSVPFNTASKALFVSVFTNPCSHKWIKISTSLYHILLFLQTNSTPSLEHDSWVKCRLKEIIHRVFENEILNTTSRNTKLS